MGMVKGLEVLEGAVVEGLDHEGEEKEGEGEAEVSKPVGQWHVQFMITVYILGG